MTAFGWLVREACAAFAQLASVRAFDRFADGDDGQMLAHAEAEQGVWEPLTTIDIDGEPYQVRVRCVDTHTSPAASAVSVVGPLSGATEHPDVAAAGEGLPQWLTDLKAATDRWVAEGCPPLQDARLQIAQALDAADPDRICGFCFEPRSKCKLPDSWHSRTAGREHFADNDPMDEAQAEWDRETGEGLADAAERVDRIAVMAAVIEKHRVMRITRPGDEIICGTPHACGLPFVGLDAWAVHVADLVDAALDPVGRAHRHMGTGLVAASSTETTRTPTAPAVADRARGGGEPDFNITRK